MTLVPGTQLGPYRIETAIGAGGMGEVWKARDTTLGRDVALKILPDHLALDPDRLARFRREAQILASLNHPNIATIHGFQESDGVQALVLELVEGPTLADRIAQGPIPVDEALPVAKQIAEALEAAHEQGIIHRDLKPANIKLRADGTVKVLDFGLAKALADDTSGSTQTMSPTITSPALITGGGVILGTAAYMSPEQAKGKIVDRRVDIWAFGALLYEMLTGRMLFGGDTVSETMAQVILKEPDWSHLPANTPSRIRELLSRCLVKEPRNRARDMGDVRLAIEEALARPEPGDSSRQVYTDPPRRSWRRALPWALAGALAVATAVSWLPQQQTAERPITRLTAEIGATAALGLANGIANALALSPDGSVFAFTTAATAAEPRQLYVRRINELTASHLPGTAGARSPFFSPDGQWLAFFAEGKLKKVSTAGGAALILCDVPNDRGGSWGSDGSIVFAPSPESGLSRVSSAGGTPEALTTLDEAAGEIAHRLPAFLPGDRAVLFTADTSSGVPHVVVQSLETGERKVLLRGGSQARYLPSGHLLYVYQDTLFAVAFDLDRLEITGSPGPAVHDLWTGRGAAQFASSEDGAIVYLSASSADAGTSIEWMDRDGKTTPLRQATGDYAYLRFSPDGKRLALELRDRQFDVWVYEWERDTMSRLTFNPGLDRSPVWSPDGQRIVFASMPEGGTLNLFWRRADGTGEAQRLTESKSVQLPYSWHPSGKFVAFVQTGDIMILPIDGDETSGWTPGTPTVFLTTPLQEDTNPAFSPDGRWLAYETRDSGGRSIYVRPFPGPGGSWQVTNNGRIAMWSPDGRQLFYRSGGSLMVVDYVVDGESFRPTKPRAWSSGSVPDSADRNLDLHPDGQRFAILKTAGTDGASGPDKVVFVFNYLDELRRIAPAAKP